MRIIVLNEFTCALPNEQESKSELEKFTGVTVMIGDAMDEAAIQKCMTGRIRTMQPVS